MHREALLAESIGQRAGAEQGVHRTLVPGGPLQPAQRRHQHFGSAYPQAVDHVRYGHAAATLAYPESLEFTPWRRASTAFQVS